MKIALATPLYPPDVAEPALFSKELARRLSQRHTVTVLAYGSLPESILGVTVQSVRKQLPIPIRLLFFTYHLWRMSRNHDSLVIENGPSTELPAVLALAFTRKNIVLHMGDAKARTRTKQSKLLTMVHNRLRRQSKVLDLTPLPRPEILPLDSYPTEAFAAYERSWEEFMDSLEATLYGK